MIDIYFIEFYIKRLYNQKIEDYYGVTKAVASNWRRNNFPERRLKEFIYRERSENIYDLFEKIYPKT